MRALTAPQLALFQAAHYGIYFRVWVEDATGVLVDRTESAVSASFEMAVDEPINQLTVSFERGFGESSYSPLMTENPPVDFGREIMFEAAASGTVGVAPADANYFEVFRGYIKSIDPTSNPVQVVALDPGGYLQQAWIESPPEEEITYGSTEGVALETVMQSILDDWDTGVTLHVPVSPAALVESYRQQSEPILQALRTLAESIGWTVRYWWNATAGEFQLTLFEPPRSKNVADWTFSPSRYLSVRELRMSDEDVRNRILVTYVDETGARKSIPPVEDTASIAKHGGPMGLPRFMRIAEGTVSPVKTPAQAVSLGGAALSDLSEPDATHAVEDFCLPFLEVHDLCGFQPNNVHYSATQRYALVKLVHDFPEQGKGRTVAHTRGKPTGGVLMWRRRQMRNPVIDAGTTEPGAYTIKDVAYRGSTDGMRTYQVFWGSRIKEAQVYWYFFLGDDLPGNWEEVVLEAGIRETIFANGAEFTVREPIEGELLYGLVVPYAEVEGQYIAKRDGAFEFQSQHLPYLEIDELDAAVDDLEELIAESTEGGIDASEAAAIAQQIQLIQAERADVDAEYADTAANPDLPATPLANLTSAHTALGLAVDSLIDTIVDAIADSVVDAGEQSDIDAAFGAWETARATYRQRYGEAIEAIKNRGVDRVYKPTVQVQASRSDTTLTMSLDIADPLLRVTAVEKRTRPHGGAVGSWDASWSSSTGTIGSSVALYRGLSLTIENGTDLEVEWRVTYTDHNGDSVPLGASVSVSNLQPTAQTIRFSFQDLKPKSTDTTWVYESSLGVSYLRSEVVGVVSEYATAVVLPKGTTLTYARARVYRHTTDDNVGFYIIKTVDTGTSEYVGDVQATTTGWSTIEFGASQLVGTEALGALAYLFPNVAVENARFLWLELVYDRDSYEAVY